MKAGANDQNYNMDRAVNTFALVIITIIDMIKIGRAHV